MFNKWFGAVHGVLSCLLPHQFYGGLYLTQKIYGVLYLAVTVARWCGYVVLLSIIAAHVQAERSTPDLSLTRLMKIEMVSVSKRREDPFQPPFEPRLRFKLPRSLELNLAFCPSPRRSIRSRQNGKFVGASQ